MRVIIFALLALNASAPCAQVPVSHLKYVDSIENVVNSGLKKYTVKKDTGHITVSKNQTASYQKEFYIDRSTNMLHLVTYLKLFSNGMLVNESYYYLRNKPLSVYRIKQLKRKAMQEEAYYFYNDQTYKQSDSTILKPNNEIKDSAEKFLMQYRKLK